MATFLSRYQNLILVIEPSLPKKPKPGKRIEFMQGRYETNDKKEIEYLRGHKKFGHLFMEIPEEKTEKPEKPEVLSKKEK